VTRFGRRAASCGISILLLALLPRAANAQEVAIALAYDRPAGCPDRAELERQIRARSSRIEIRTDAQRAFRVAIETEPRPHALIEMSEGGGASAVRELDGETCREVVAAAALVVAVLSDPEAGELPTPATPERAPVDSALPERDRAAPEARRPVAGSGATDATREARPIRVRGVLGFGLSIEGGRAPDLALSPRPLVGIELGSGAIHPAFRLSGARARSGSIATSSGIAQLTWTAGRVDGCAAFGDSGPVAEACASFEAGQIRGRGRETENPENTGQVWLAPGLIGRAGWELEGALRIELDAGIQFPLLRYRFYFGPDVTAYEVPGAALTSGIFVLALF
jgi:hypothetical protein